MKRYLIAAMVSVALSASADAQFMEVGPPPLMPSLNPPPVPGPTPAPGPPIATQGGGFYKSGGVFVGANGVYPYDTGLYLLGGTDGFARSTGTFRMVPAVGGLADPGAGFGIQDYGNGDCAFGGHGGQKGCGLGCRLHSHKR